MSNIARHSSGLCTVNSIGRVLRSPSIAIAAARDTEKLSHRFHSGFHASTASISMKVAKASLSQMPFHHRIVTRSPNHMCAFSCDTTSATRSSSARDAVFSSASSGLAESNRAEILHGAGSEVGNRDQVELVAGVWKAVVIGEELERKGADPAGERRQIRFARHVNNPERRARIHGRRRFEFADDKGKQIGGHHDRFLENDLLLAACELAFAFLAAVGNGREVFVNHQDHLVAGLQLGLIPARECAACVGGLELGRGNDVCVAGCVGVLAAIKAVELVVENSAKDDPEDVFAGGKRLRELQMGPFLLRLHPHRGLERFSSPFDGRGIDLQFQRVEDDFVCRFNDGDFDVLVALECKSLEVRFKPQHVAPRPDIFRQPIVVDLLAFGSTFLVAHDGFLRDECSTRAQEHPRPTVRQSWIWSENRAQRRNQVSSLPPRLSGWRRLCAVYPSTNGRSIQRTSQYRPNLRPTSENTPTSLKPNWRCSFTEGSLGMVIPATRRRRSAPRSASNNVRYIVRPMPRPVASGAQ